MAKTKKMKELLSALEGWVGRHRDKEFGYFPKVVCLGIFISFDDKKKVLEEVKFAYGKKDYLQAVSKELNNLIDKEKCGFVNINFLPK